MPAEINIPSRLPVLPHSFGQEASHFCGKTSDMVIIELDIHRKVTTNEVLKTKKCIYIYT